MSLVVFRSECHVYPPFPQSDPDNPGPIVPRARLCLEIELSQTNTSEVHFRLKQLGEGEGCDGGVEKGLLTFGLNDPHDLNDVDNLQHSTEIEIDLNADVDGRSAGERFAEMGLIGLPLNAAGMTSRVEISSVRIVLRPAQPDGSWTSKAPFFSLIACWRINATAGGDGEVIQGEDRAEFSAQATADVMVCAGFSCIYNPVKYAIGLPSFQVRLDLEALGLTTGWQPFSWLDFGGFSDFHLNGLGRWFAELLDIDLDAQLPNVFDDIELPDWDVNFPLSFDLPLGLGFKDSYFAIRRINGGYGIDAWAKRLLLSWQGMDTEFPDVELALKLEPAGDNDWKYLFSARLAEWVYPALDGSGRRSPYQFSLPMDLLGLSAECFRFRVGLNSSGSTNDELGDLCIEALLEIGGLKVFSHIAGGTAEPFFKTDLRLLTRNLNVLTGVPTAPTKLRMFDNLDEIPPPIPFRKYYDHELGNSGKKLGVTFASDLNAPPSNDPANDYGIEIIDGEFRKGERIYLAWSQSGDQFLRALSHDLFSTPPAGEVPDGSKRLNVGLEITQFGEDDIQVRLDWFEGNGEQPNLEATNDLPPVGWKRIEDSKGFQLKFEDIKDSPIVLPPVETDKSFDLELPPDPFSVQLPGIRVGVARPAAKSLIFRQDGDAKEAAFLFFYGADTTTPSVTRLIAKAELDFSMTGDDGAREVMRTREKSGANDRRPFFELGLGYAGARDTAIQIVGWKQGRSPRFFQVYSETAPKISSIAKLLEAPSSLDSCPQPKPPQLPPVLISVDSFQSPRFESDGWRMGLRFAAQESVVDLFSGSGNDVKFSIDRIFKPDDNDYLLIFAELDLTLTGGFNVTGEITFRFDPSDFSLTIHDAASLSIKREVIKEEPGWVSQVPLPEKERKAKRFWALLDNDILGLKVSFFTDLKPQDPNGPLPDLKEIDVLTLVIADGRLALGLPPDTNMVLRYTDMGQDSLSFLVDRFDLGPGGLNLSASLLSSALTVRGLKKPFALRQAMLEVRDDRLSTLSISASGALPELLDEAPVDVTATFVQKQRGGRIELDELICRLGDEDSPIFSRGTRFKFEVSTLDLRYIRPSPAEERHFFFEVSGSAQFTPDEGEFDGGLLEDLKSAKIEFVRAPLTEEFAQHLSLSVELNEPVTFDVFNIFKMEIRSIGFHPNFTFDEPSPALIIGGQVEFADLGDVPSVEIDFHAMYLGLPKPGESVPQVHFDGLRVEISSPEGFRIAGRVDRYDTPLLKGFAGEGTVYIPGFPEVSAAFAFVRLRGVDTDPWQRAWFIAVEAAKMSYQMPALPFYLRQIGLGFGYRYTLPLIKEFEEPDTLAQVIARMLKALDRHQSLARIESWTPDPDRTGKPALWTIALEAVFTLGTTQAKPFDYEAKRELKLKTIIAQIIAAIRSDFTLIAAAKIWLPVSVEDFFNDEEGMRHRPLARGFTIYSAPQRRFLVHAAKGMNPYIGKKDDPWPEQVVKILDSVHFEATMLIEPGLLHAELGWPDRLYFQLKVGALVIDCRGGVLFRVENDAIIQGIFFSARGTMDLAGGVSLGFVGFRISAHVEVYFAARLMSALYLSRPLGSKIYAQVGVDVAVRFSVQAWLRLKIGFCRISINISFSLTLQIVIGLEVGWAGGMDLGFRGRATVLVGVFGRSLRASVAVGINEGGVIAARAALAPYMGPFLEPGDPPQVPDGNPLGGNVHRPAIAKSVQNEKIALTANAEPDSDLTKEWFVTSHVVSANEEYAYLWIMPAPASPFFYPVGINTPNGWHTYAHLKLPDDQSDVEFIDVDDTGLLMWKKKPMDGVISLKARHGKTMQLSTEGDSPATLNLQQCLAGCNLIDPDDILDQYGNYFPEYWPDHHPDFVELHEHDPEQDVLRFEDSHSRHTGGEGGIIRKLDPGSQYDAVIIQAMNEEAPPEKSTESLRNQAFGNRSFVMQGFYDDLIALTDCGDATTTGGVCPVLDRLSKADRPSIVDLGMVIRVKRKNGKLPTWVVDRDDTNGPKLWFDSDVKPGGMPNKELQAVPVRPIVDFERVNFQSYPPIFSDASANFDDETIALRWKLEWPGEEKPNAADNVDNNPEAFLRAYRIEFVDLLNNAALKSMTSKPADLIVENGDGSLVQIRSRFQVTVPLSGLFPEKIASGQELRRIGVTVTPIDQVGRLGESYTFTLDQEPSLTPLPADQAKCRLEASGSDQQNKHFVAVLSWLEPSIPSQRGISKTDRWQVIFRPLREIPLGAYPDDTAEATERGLMSVTGQALQEGDIILRLPGGESSGPWKKERVSHGSGSDESEESVDFKHVLQFEPENFNPTEQAGDLYQPYPGWDVLDHKGVPLTINDPLVGDLIAFLTGLSPGQHSDHDQHPATGKAWRLFLRAETRRERKQGEVVSTYSGLSPVRLTALLKPDISNNPSVTSSRESASNSSEKGLNERPLPHFEWPTRNLPYVLPKNAKQPGISPRQIQMPRAISGGLHIPLLLDSIDDKPALRYFPEPGRARAVTLEWSAVQEIKSDTDQDGGKQGYIETCGYESIAEYQVHETPLDALLNADLDPSSGFKPPWRQITRLKPADRRNAGQVPDNMDDTQNWVAWTPAFARSLKWLDDADLPENEWSRAWPAWYSWAESELLWPPDAKDFEKELLNKSGTDERAPFEVLNEASTQPIQKLAAWRDLGEQAAGSRMHPYLCMLVGVLVDRRTYQNVGDELKRGPLFNVQASTGQPVQITDALAWLRANNEAVDPYGWAALSHLGLNVALSLRDKDTGLLYDQAHIRKELDDARQNLEATLEKAFEGKLPTNFVELTEKHLSFDYPIQTTWSARSDAGQASLDDAALWMVQLSLRPIPEQVFGYTLLKVKPKMKPSNDELKAPHDLRMFFLDASRPVVTLEKDKRKFFANAFFVAPEIDTEGKPKSQYRILVQHLEPGKSWRDLIVWNDHVDLLPEIFDPLPLSAGTRPGDISPFGRFAVPENHWISRFYTEEEKGAPATRECLEGSEFDKVLIALGRAFGRRVVPETEDGGQTKTPEQIEDALLRERDIHKIYLAWSARFHASAPLASGERYTLAAPKQVDPIHIAANRQGVIRVTRLVEEEWASTRSFAVTMTGRYDRLRRAMLDDEESKPIILSMEPAVRADAQLPRIRRVEPPQLLGERALQAADGRWFNELAVATHAEESLTNSNVEVAKKLDFGVVMRRYMREFRYQPWLKKFSENLPENALPKLPGPVEMRIPDEYKRPDLSESRNTFLAHVPKSRWGASRYVTPAEPFYYDVQVELVATAAEEQSIIKQTPLSPGQPGNPRPVIANPMCSGGDTGRPFQVRPLNGWSEVDEDINSRFGDWTAKLNKDIAVHTLPDGWELNIRAPRYIESLSSDSLGTEGYYRAELIANSVGNLPDDGLSLQVVMDLVGTKEAIATITLSSKDGFQSRVVSREFGISEDLIVYKSNWTEGTWLETAFYRTPDTQDVDEKVLTTGGHPFPSDILRLPESLVEPGPGLLGANELPRSGPMAQLAPLAMRLSFDTTNNKLSLSYLREGPAWLTRPSLPIGTDRAPYEKYELALALQILCSWPRRHAAAVISYDIIRAQDSGSSTDDLRSLLRLVEQASHLYLGEMREPGHIDSAYLESLTRSKLELWVKPEAMDWQIVDRPMETKVGETLLVLAEIDSDDQEFVKVVNRWALDSGMVSDPAQQRSIRLLTEALAAKSSLRARALKPDIYTQRGNEPRVLWARGDEADES